jgi:hypothetical protein
MASFLSRLWPFGKKKVAPPLGQPAPVLPKPERAPYEVREPRATSVPTLDAKVNEPKSMIETYHSLVEWLSETGGLKRIDNPKLRAKIESWAKDATEDDLLEIEKHLFGKGVELWKANLPLSKPHYISPLSEVVTVMAEMYAALYLRGLKTGLEPMLSAAQSNHPVAIVAAYDVYTEVVTHQPNRKQEFEPLMAVCLEHREYFECTEPEHADDSASDAQELASAAT